MVNKVSYKELEDNIDKRIDKIIPQIDEMFNDVSKLPKGEDRNIKLLNIIDFMYENLHNSPYDEIQSNIKSHNYCRSKCNEFREELTYIKNNLEKYSK